MILAAVGDTGYDLVLTLHILTVITSFGPAITFPMLAMAAEKEGDLVRFARWAGGVPAKVVMVSSILAGVFGGMLIGFSDDAWKFEQTWIWLAIVLWVALLGVQHALLFPAERRLMAGDRHALTKVRQAGSLTSLIFLVTTVVMVFKPGL